MDADATSQNSQASNLVDVYTTSLILEGELPSAEMQAAVGNNYWKLQYAFNNFMNMLNKTWQKQKMSTKPKRKATLEDMLTRASSLSKCQLYCSLFFLKNKF